MDPTQTKLDLPAVFLPLCSCGHVAGKLGVKGNGRNAQNAKGGPGGAWALLVACQLVIHASVQAFIAELHYYKQVNNNKSAGQSAMEKWQIKERGMGVLEMASGSYVNGSPGRPC